MTINLQTGGYVPPQPLPVARGADIQVEQKQVQRDTVINAPEAKTALPSAVASAEEKRYERVAAAAQHVVANSYPVGDKSFAIYKDASGQYITRYKSLRDGRVTYIPEQRALREFESRYQRQDALVQIQA